MQTFFFFELSFIFISGLICFCFSGIFVYLNYLVPATRQEILEILLNGLKRLEYRGYDSAGKFGAFGMILVLRSSYANLWTVVETHVKYMYTHHNV